MGGQSTRETRADKIDTEIRKPAAQRPKAKDQKAAPRPPKINNKKTKIKIKNARSYPRTRAGPLK